MIPAITLRLIVDLGQPSSFRSMLVLVYNFDIFRVNTVILSPELLPPPVGLLVVLVLYPTKLLGFLELSLDLLLRGDKIVKTLVVGVIVIV